MRTCKDESVKFTGPILSVFGVQLLFGIILIIPILGWVAGAILSIMYYNAPAIRYLQISEVVHKTKPAQA
ncbi:MAG TPA: hypothetical protein VMR95_01670 [Candidatus Binatia bacterium]|nr:hypothetical protein [Candidatus Binatia bacterium]